MVTIEEARVGLIWLEAEWVALRDEPPTDQDREAQFALRLTAWVQWDLQLWIHGKYKSCVMGDDKMCPANAPLCCGGCARKRVGMLK